IYATWPELQHKCLAVGYLAYMFRVQLILEGIFNVLAKIYGANNILGGNMETNSKNYIFVCALDIPKFQKNISQMVKHLCL
ncbi:hypothetical protein ACJX0J_022503, partial [Zea mays]